MAGDDDKQPSFASMRLRTKPRRRRTGWEPQAFLFDGLPEQEEPVAVPPVVRPVLPLPEPVAAMPEPMTAMPEPVTAMRAALLKAEPAVFAAPAEPRVWTVRALVTDIRQRVEGGYADLVVEGEISNLRPATSGHLYFTLKDGEAQLPVVLFRRQAMLLRFKPKDGDEIQLRGRLSVYESRGQLQLVGETMELRGAGALQLAFERLKARLLAEGLFDAARKRPMPPFPRCIGVVTSASGAVIQDMVNVVRRRHARLNLLVYPATMQGVRCAATVAAGVRWFNAHPERVDLIVIARGGGSTEDLAGFNDEGLARVIAGSVLPLVSAVGHETDFTIADFVADLRAPTPSAAAELITAAQHRIEERLEALLRRAHRAMAYQMLRVRRRLERLSAASVLARVQDGVSRRDQRLDDLRFRLETTAGRRVRQAGLRLEGLAARLGRQDPRLQLAISHRRLASAESCLMRAGEAMLTRRRMRLAQGGARLHALSPVAVLSRGYALVYSASGTLLRAATEAAPGETIHARLGQGSLTARILENAP